MGLAEKTQGKISKLLEDKPDGPAVLLNAVYFKVCVCVCVRACVRACIISWPCCAAQSGLFQGTNYMYI